MKLSYRLDKKFEWLFNIWWQRLNIISEPVWNFWKAAVLTPKNKLNDLQTHSGKHKIEGLLAVTFVNQQTGEHRTGSVCKNQFNWLSANLFCQLLHYQFGEWDEIPRTLYVLFLSLEPFQQFFWKRKLFF